MKMLEGRYKPQWPVSELHHGNQRCSLHLLLLHCSLEVHLLHAAIVIRATHPKIVGTVKERKSILRKAGRCVSCLKRGHIVRQCRASP